MTTGAQPFAKAKLYIGTTLVVDYDEAIADAVVAAAAEVDVFTEIKPIEDAGEGGDESTEIEFTAVGEGRTETFKGTKKGTPMDLSLGFVPSDAGQVALEAAYNASSHLNYNFKLELNDDPGGSGSNPTAFYWAGKVTQHRTRFGGANNVVMRLARISVDTRTVVIPAAP